MSEEKEEQQEEKEIVKTIQISPQTLTILRRLFDEMEAKKKELNEADKKLKDAILISMTSNGIEEINFFDWQTNLDLGIHIKNG